jgi:hypothetical protein
MRFGLNVKWRTRQLSKLFRNVPLLTSLEMSPFSPLSLSLWFPSKNFALGCPRSGDSGLG